MPSHNPANPQNADDFKKIADDNDQRIWYITRYSTADNEFPSEKLQTLITFKNRIRNNDTNFTDQEELEYRIATIAAARFIGARRPETIREFAAIQRREINNRYHQWYWVLGFTLIIALLFYGYQALISRQVTEMKTQVSSYVKEGQVLVNGTDDIGAILSRMCQQTLNYRTASAQLSRFLFWVSDPKSKDDELLKETQTGSPSGISDSDDLEARRPGACSVLAATARKVPPQDTTALPSANDTSNANGNSNGKLPQFPRPVRIKTDGTPEFDPEEFKAYWSNPVVVMAREAAVDAQLTTLKTREAMSRGETAAEFLNMLALPLLFALLGALTAALRTANARLKAMTLTRIDNGGLIAKVLLGVVAGTTVGIVFSTSADMAGASGLTQLGLAFVLGYAVDIFFNLLDAVRTGLGSNRERLDPD